MGRLVEGIQRQPPSGRGDRGLELILSNVAADDSFESTG